VRLSLRVRFALLAGLLVLVVAALAAFAGYLAMRSSLYDRAARTAQGQARQLAALVDVNAANGASNQVDITDRTLTHELALPGTLIEVARPNGTLIQASGRQPPQLAGSFTSRCLSTGHGTAELSTPPFSLSCQRVGPGSAPVGLITVGAPLNDALASLSTLRTALLIGVLGGALLSAALALLVARRALRPVRRIADTAETIRSGDLSQRIGYRGNDELGRLAAVLDACFAELERALERQRRFGADASHELRTPLAAIRANVELLRGWAARDPAARDAAVASLDHASIRANRLVEDLLYLARLEQEPPSARAPVALDDLVLGVVREAQQLRPSVSIEVSRLAEATVDGDALRLQQLLLNVLDNALRVSPSESTVTVHLAAEGERATIRVADQGPGVQPEELERIFDRLYSRSGSGLGLAIARAIARDHGGELRAHNNPDRGATFTLTLPLAIIPEDGGRGTRGQVAARVVHDAL
jgi:signal transduction histidine kinase